ncbi:PREDICTED: cyclin-P3-1 [Prunus dulcis]|uniref:Cyclin n=1 Tax=Prunus dulcis TaxID=3755 RepID=A0A5E4EA42_PRUDU|nr:cyclin-P3-1 [Prunus dulcis]VVA12707.1 PREDICTED: cyclin-P3-1 [Prunus dulcis]
MGTVALDATVFTALGILGKSATRTPRVLSVVSSVFERSIRKNEKLIRRSKMKDVITMFHASEVPALSIRRYIERIFKYSSCSPSCFVVAYIYIERFLQRTGICLTSLNIHRLLITSIMVAAKFMDDECYSNAYHAKIGGVSLSELNKLEIEFLLSLDFKLHVTINTFGKYCRQLEDGVGENQISLRASSIHGD